MIAAKLLLSLHLAGAPPVFVDDRAEIPWIVVATPGASCGSIKSLAGPRTKKESLLASLSKTPEPKKTAPTKKSTLPLLPAPGLLGVEGKVVVIAAERMLQKLGVGGPVTLRIDTTGAWLELPPLPPSTTLTPNFSQVELGAIVEEAVARAAHDRGVIGAAATEKAQRFGCFNVAEDPAVPNDIGRRLRARFAVAVR